MPYVVINEAANQSIHSRLVNTLLCHRLIWQGAKDCASVQHLLMLKLADKIHCTAEV